MAEYAKTIDELAGKFRTSRQTITEWKRKKDFPQPTSRGLWNVGKIDAWCRKHNVGPYRKGVAPPDNGESGGGNFVSQYEANRRKTLYQAENERIKSENAAVEQAKLLGTVLDIDDVRSTFAQMVATVMACADGTVTAIDRALPESMSPESRDRVLAITKKFMSDVAVAMEKVW